jgi:PhnB protein
MQLNPYLFFAGQCEAAFKFYAQVLDGKITAMMPHRNSPAQAHVPADWADKIMHARLEAGNIVLMGADAPPGRQNPMKGFSVMLDVTDPADADRKFQALAEGGTVGMPIEKTFFAARFGMLVDRFGTPWMVHCAEAH